MNDKLPLMLNAFFGVLILVSLVLLFSGVPDSQPADSQGGLAANGSSTIATQSRALVRKIASYHLFGHAEKSRPEVRRAPTVAPETRLKLTLSGVLAATAEQQAARAIIAGPDGHGKSYTINDRLPGGAVVKEIHPDRVILTRHGKYETLRLPRTRLKLNNQKK